MPLEKKPSPIGRPPLEKLCKVPPLPSKHAKISNQKAKEMKQLRAIVLNKHASLRYRRRKKQQLEEASATLVAVEQANQSLEAKELRLKSTLSWMKCCLELHATTGCAMCQQIKLTSEYKLLRTSSTMQPMVTIKQEGVEFLDMGHIFDP